MNGQNKIHEEMWQKYEKNHRRGKIVSGLLIIIIGSLFLARELGAEIPSWVLSWKMLLIGIGLMIGFKHKFKNMSWLFLVVIGSAFLISDIYPDWQLKPVIWPLLLILIGVIMVFKPRNKHCGNEKFMRRHWQHGKHGSSDPYVAEYYAKTDYNNDDVIESTCIFSGTKKSVLSKNFKGGEVITIFGGTELNLMQTDFEGSAKLEIEQVFGGTKLLVPAHWEIKSELVTIFGSLEDKRPLPAVGVEKTKTLILIGTTVFGGIEIRSY